MVIQDILPVDLVTRQASLEAIRLLLEAIHQRRVQGAILQPRVLGATLLPQVLGATPLPQVLGAIPLPQVIHLHLGQVAIHRRVLDTREWLGMPLHKLLEAILLPRVAISKVQEPEDTRLLLARQAIHQEHIQEVLATTHNQFHPVLCLPQQRSVRILLVSIHFFVMVAGCVCTILLGTCKALRFDLNSNWTSRFDLKMTGRFENFELLRLPCFAFVR